jgi:hypothetical protein
MDRIIEIVEDVMEVTLESIRLASVIPAKKRPQINMTGWGQLQTLYNLLVELVQLLDQGDSAQPILLNKKNLKYFFRHADCFFCDIDSYPLRAIELYDEGAESQLLYIENSCFLKSSIENIRDSTCSDQSFKTRKELNATLS